MNQRYMAIRDRRLKGGVPAHAHLAIQNTDASTPLKGVLHHVSAHARMGKIHTLFILCNGAFNFGTWEGNLYRFAARTGMGSVVAAVPAELTDVLNGTAP